MATRGLLLVNVGSPEAPNTKSVRRYLRQFLSDPKILDMPAWGRFLLLNTVILPFRPKKSAEAYQSIWDAQKGSPLVFLSQEFCSELQSQLGSDWNVRLAMRCGRPSIKEEIQNLVQSNVESITVFPLFPHFAASTSVSAVDEVYRVLRTRWNFPPVSIVPSFHSDSMYIKALAASMRPFVVASPNAHLLLSYHGLPESHIEKTLPKAKNCLSDLPSCCDQMTQENQWCYRAQCVASSRALQSELGLSSDRITSTFQSRFGRTQWIGPDTESTLTKLAKNGIKHLLVACPAFVTDCLETLEEIGIRGRKTFIAAGGEDFQLIPCLNANPDWIQVAKNLVLAAAPE